VLANVKNVDVSTVYVYVGGEVAGVTGVAVMSATTRGLIAASGKRLETAPVVVFP
jgi:uncharacterized FAD-dependent dehydrogenase